ncbi:SDR family oxidoreductase, partial [bacterium]|nr:SDR family oxidoreductase [bacterium]
MARFTVTGCCGFIGSNLVQALLDAGHLVTGLDDLSTGFKENIEAFLSHSSFSFIEGDIRDPELCSVACDGADYVLHQAALGSVPRSLEYPALYNSVNIGGTLNMLNAARDAKVKRFVFASSSSVYGDTAVLPKVETMIPNPKSPYAVTKITCEYFAKVYNDAYRLPTIGLRYFNVFGARQNPASQYAAVIPKFVTAFLKNESPTIFGDGAQTRDFTYIDNVVMANLKACDAPLSSCGVSYNIGCGGRISLNQLAQEIQHLTQSSAVPTYGPARAGDVRDSLADVRLAETCLGLQNLIQLRDG